MEQKGLFISRTLLTNKAFSTISGQIKSPAWDGGLLYKKRELLKEFNAALIKGGGFCGGRSGSKFAGNFTLRYTKIFAWIHIKQKLHGR